MSKAICINGLIRRKITFIEGEEYEYTHNYSRDGESIYIVSCLDYDYLSSFIEKDFNYYFEDIKEIRERKIKDLLK